MRPVLNVKHEEPRGPKLNANLRHSAHGHGCVVSAHCGGTNVGDRVKRILVLYSTSRVLNNVEALRPILAHRDAASGGLSWSAEISWYCPAHAVGPNTGSWIYYIHVDCTTRLNYTLAADRRLVAAGLRST